MIHLTNSAIGVLIEKMKTMTNDSERRCAIRLGKNFQRARMEFPWGMRVIS